MNRGKYLFGFFIYLTAGMLVTLLLLNWKAVRIMQPQVISYSVVEDVKQRTISSEMNAFLTASQINYTSKKEQCDDYGLTFNLYPSLYGFEYCETYAFNHSIEIQAKRGIVCVSRGSIQLAVFAKSKEQQIECYIRNSKFSCFPRTDNYAVCGCDICTSTSILNNLPITDYKPSRRVISFSVYGNSRDYVCGVLRQIRLAKIFFPDWTSRVYLNTSVPANIAAMIKREAQVVEIPKNSSLGNSGMFWRFLVASDKEVDVYCIRDADSVLTFREANAINKWIASGTGFNLMRDHEYHNTNIVGCCWCGQKKIRNIHSLILQWSSRDKFGDDQNFLNSQIWPIINNDVLIYDTCESRRNNKETIPFPIERIACEFTGIAHRVGFYMWNYYQYLCYENNDNVFVEDYGGDWLRGSHEVLKPKEPENESVVWLP